MNNSTNHPFAIAQRQSPYAIFIMILKFVRRFIRMFWVVIVSFFFSSQKGAFLGVSYSLIALFFSGFSLIFAILNYYRYYFFVDETAVNIQKGILNKKKISLPFERIQNINFEQKILHQIFGVVSVQIDTAGASSNEIEIDALPKDQAEQLRDYILDKKRALQQEIDTVLDLDSEETPSASKPAVIIDEPILQLSPLDLIKVGISQNHLRTFLLITGVFFSFLDDIKRITKIDAIDFLVDQSSFSSFFLYVTILLLFSFLGTLIQTVLKHFNLTFYKNEEGFKLNAGLFTRKEVALRKEKIQIVQWSDNPIRKLFNIFTLSIKQASAIAQASQQQKVQIVGCYQHQIDDVLKNSFSNHAQDSFEYFQVQKKYIGRMFLYFGGIPFGIFILNFLLTFNYLFLIPAIGIPLIALFMIKTFQHKFRLSIGNEYLEIKRGIFGDHFTVLPIYKIQAIELIQGIYQRRKSLASLQIHTANGQLSIPYLKLEEAYKIKNYLLYCIETSKKDWM